MAEKNEGIWFAGDVYFQQYINGVLSATVIGAIDGTKLLITPQGEVIARKSKGKADYGKTVGRVIKAAATKVVVGFDGVDSQMMAMIFQGELSVLSIAGGTITGESITLKHDQWVRCSQRNISSVTITGSALGTDFEVHREMGAIKALSDGNLADGAAVSFNAVHGGITGENIKAGLVPEIDLKLTLDGKNRESGSDVYLEIPQVTLTSGGDFEWLSDDYVTVDLSGEMVKLDDEDAEYYINNKPVYA